MSLHIGPRPVCPFCQQAKAITRSGLPTGRAHCGVCRRYFDVTPVSPSRPAAPETPRPLTDDLCQQLFDEAQKARLSAYRDARLMGMSDAQATECATAALAETVRSFLAQAGVL